MSPKLRLAFFLMPLVLFLLVAVFLFKGLFSDPTRLDSALVGREVPQFELPDLYQPDVTHDNRIIGTRPLLINVWATWCPTCYAEHTFLNQLLAEEQVYIIGLNYKDDSRGAAVRWLQNLGDPYAINLFDETGLLALDLGVYGAPETYVVDQHGVILYRHVGDLNERVWRQEVGPIYYRAMRDAGLPIPEHRRELVL
ncbi:DsbE family thiol:disulfide interchange protein [Aliidiomarina haloalkalitolerans]|uniref:DsbE family thiol:disulfide interchange protein n=1 Tax=Aliidiomarina haloalkalitolerans TaxID=859059 RepID=A0A432VQ09_9GAMM|nr:DsbE family thiol:disulfide interchange protein [Aliidiomarina haloalkalitolerans]RUO18216.1 DsbE family thiol:disulfide interchange protein [Aliidiomarina haloalkalitolerans]